MAIRGNRVRFWSWFRSIYKLCMNVDILVELIRRQEKIMESRSEEGLLQ